MAHVARLHTCSATSDRRHRCALSLFLCAVQVGCVSANPSCGYCADDRPPEGLSWSEYGIGQERRGCLRCHAEGCGRGPASGTCRLWAYETRLLEPARTRAEAAMLRAANVTEPRPPHYERATASGELVDAQPRYFRLRPPHGGLRLVVSARIASGGLRLFARRRLAPSVQPDPAAPERDQHDVHSMRGDPYVLLVPAHQLACPPIGATDAEDGTASARRAARAPLHPPCDAGEGGGSGVIVIGPECAPSLTFVPCDEWVVGIVGTAHRVAAAADAFVTPQHHTTPFELTARWEPDAIDFGCEADEDGDDQEDDDDEEDDDDGGADREDAHGGVDYGSVEEVSAHDAGSPPMTPAHSSLVGVLQSVCNTSRSVGWAAGHSAQFVADDTGHVVARLTNDTFQRGTLWLQNPQPYSRGFELNFSFRISAPSLCTGPAEVLGHNDTRIYQPADAQDDATRSAIPGERSAKFAVSSALHLDASHNFIPYEDLRAALGDEMTHYLIDDDALPFQPLGPPRGVPPQLQEQISMSPNPDTRYGDFVPLPASGTRAPYLPRTNLRCQADADRVGGEGFAVVLQSIAPDAAGCAGSGVGYAAGSQPGGVPGCAGGGIPRSVALQFDTHHHARHVTTTTCVDEDTSAGVCRPGALKTVTTVETSRQHALSVFLDGVNVEGTQLLTHLLGRRPPLRLDDAREHEVQLVYVPPAGDAAGKLHVFFDEGEPPGRQPTLTLPITLPMAPPAGCAVAAAAAMVAAAAGSGSAGSEVPEAAGGAAQDGTAEVEAPVGAEGECTLAQMLPGAVSTEMADVPVRWGRQPLVTAPSGQAFDTASTRSPITMPGTAVPVPASPADGDDLVYRAYVGFTASTGEASARHDIRRAAYCHKLGCTAL